MAGIILLFSATDDISSSLFPQFSKRDYRGLSSVTEISQLSSLSEAGIILLFSATDDISSSLFRLKSQKVN